MTSRLRKVSVTTSWAALPAVSGSKVYILNNTGADLLIRETGNAVSGESITIEDAQDVTLSVTEKASEIEISAAAGAAGVQLVIE